MECSAVQRSAVQRSAVEWSEGGGGVSECVVEGGWVGR